MIIWEVVVVVVAVLPLLNDVMWCLFYAGYMVVDYPLKNYMLIIIECEISPLLLENVALRMGNLQVI